MICQSVNNHGDELVLNGPLTRLGVSEDVVRIGKATCSIGLTYTIRNPFRRNHIQNVNCNVSLGPSAASEKKTSELSTLTISAITLSYENENEKEKEIAVQSSNMNKDDIEICKCLLKEFDPSKLTILKASEKDTKRFTRTYVVFHGLQPITIMKLRTNNAAYKAHKQTLEKLLSSGLRFSNREDAVYLDALNDWINKNCAPDESKHERFRSPKGVKQLSKQLDNLSNDLRDNMVEEIAVNLAKERPHLIQHLTDYSLLNYYESQDESNVQLEALNELSIILRGLSSSFSDIAMRVIYIGPLRDDPRVISPLTDETGTNIPIGIKGERTAAVLLSEYDFESKFGFPDSPDFKQATLGEAINAWSQYLGVAKAVHASNKQKLGVSINVESDAGERDLTQIGVGASQAIPILVGVLSAEEGAIVVIEQPELHLHPSAQAKLADFLLFARPDVSVIVESHSEALITRLRRRVVENERLAKRIDIQFFQKDSRDSGVVGHSLQIDEYGNLNAWPAGFMDAVQEDSRFIMKTAIAKRKSKHESNKDA